MGYWSDERKDLKETIRMINQGAIRKAQENAELKEEIEELKMQIKNMQDAKEGHTAQEKDSATLLNEVDKDVGPPKNMREA
jgi:septal ring factor EnvC (AmiA/AmiB activator)